MTPPALSRPLRSQPTRDRILEEARRQFGSGGFDRTTIRSIAAAAGIHPSMVMRYHGSKESLFAEVADFDLQMPALSATPRQELGRTLVRHFLKRWKSNSGDLPALLRVAVTHEGARMRLQDIFRSQVVPVLRNICGEEDAEQCAALLATQTLGLALTRYVLRLSPVVELSEGVIVERIGETLQAYLTPPAKRVRVQAAEGKSGSRPRKAP